MSDEMELGINAARSGQKTKALQYFEIVLQNEPDNPIAWLWTAGVVEDPEKKRKCLDHVLELDPGNPAALRALADIGINTARTIRTSISPDTHPNPFVNENTATTRQSKYDVFISGGTLPLEIGSDHESKKHIGFRDILALLLFFAAIAVSVGSIIWLIFNN